jgi:hypothetical protein
MSKFLIEQDFQAVGLKVYSQLGVVMNKTIHVIRNYEIKVCYFMSLIVLFSIFFSSKTTAIIALDGVLSAKEASIPKNEILYPYTTVTIRGPKICVFSW